MSFDDINSVLLGTFTHNRKRIRILFHKGVIIWDNEKPPSDQQMLPIENVIAVHHNFKDNTHPADKKVVDPNYFTIHYAKVGKDAKWLYKRLTLKHYDEKVVITWVKTLQGQLQNFKKRIKRLLLFVNPFGGKRNAMQIYEKYGKFLFSIAGVDVTVNVSQRKDQIRDFLINHNLDMYDSVACVGGDGTVSEIFNGLVLKECRKLNIDPDNIDEDLPKPKLPIGIIPGGSTDTIAYCIHGTTDPTTAVLQIIFGDQIGMDLVSVYDETSLLRLYASVLSYGYLGDVAYHSDQYRWLGPHRYDYSGFNKLMLNRGYEGEIAMYTSKAEVDKVECVGNCQHCAQSAKDEAKTKEDRKWVTLTGKFFMVSGANISCACSRSPKGIAPYSHLGDGKVHIVLVRHTSILNNLRLLLKLSSNNAYVEDLPFVETFAAEEFCFRAVDGPSRWNCDGEVQQQTNIRAKVRCQLLTILSRGSPGLVNSKEQCCGL